MSKEKVFLSVVFMFLWLSLPLRAVSASSPALTSASHNAYTTNLNEKVRKAETALNSCRSKCQSNNNHYSQAQCDTLVCGNQKASYNSLKQELDKISFSSSVINQKENTVAQKKKSWDSCISRCQNDPSTNYTYEYCSNQVCKNQKNTYENLRSQADKTNQGISDFNTQTNEEANQEQSGGQKAVIDQVRGTRDKMNALAYVAAGSTAFLAYKAATCAAQCPHGCCPAAPVFAGMAALAGVQTAKMFKKRSDLNKTCQDMSVDGVCNVDGGADSSTVDDPVIPTPLPPGCDLNPSLCDPAVYGSIIDCSPGDPSCSSAGSGASSVIPSENAGSIAGDAGSIAGDAGSIASTDNKKKVSDILSKASEPKNGWNSGKNPFNESHEFDYNDMTSAEKEKIDKAMGNFNQKKMDYLDGLGLTNIKDGGVGDGYGDDSNKGVLDDEVDISTQFPVTKDALSQQASLAGGNKNTGRRRIRPAKRGISSADKLHELFKKNMAGKKSASPFSKMSVSFGDDNVGVREDNIFLMVHRMNRNLDEQENRFLKSF